MPAMAPVARSRQMKTGQSLLVAAAGVLAGVPALPAELAIKITLPQIAANGPRPPTRPYVAIWLRKEDNSFAQDLAVWYQVESPRRRGPEGGMGPPGGAAPGGMAPPRGGFGP